MTKYILIPVAAPHFAVEIFGSEGIQLAIVGLIEISSLVNMVVKFRSKFFNMTLTASLKIS